jgi:arylsulfatase A-like enzyme
LRRADALCCLAALLTPWFGCDGAPEPRDRRPPVVIVSIDTLRADRLPAYGYRGVQTPAIDRLAHDAIRYENAYAPVPLTLPSHVSLITGLLPSAHGVRDNIGYRLDADRPDSLPALLRPLGYATGAVVSAYVLRSSTGIGPLFDHYDDAIEVTTGATLGELERAAPATVREAWRWVEPRIHQPFLLFVHLYEPHAPYSPPEPWAGRYGSSYDGEVAAADAAVGDLLARLRDAGVYDRALVFLLSDHGEGLGDHGEKEHGLLLYRSTLHIPLLVKLPNNRRAGETVAAPVQLVDVVPTVAEVIGFDPPPDLPGRSLLGAEKAGGERNLYAETFYPRLHFGWSELRSLIGSRYHYIEGPNPELFDLVTDPGEVSNVLEIERRVSRDLHEQIRAQHDELRAPDEIDPEEARKLAALGYLSRTVESRGESRLDPRLGLEALDRIQQALQLSAAGDHRAAAAILADLVTRFPDMLDAHFNLAAVLHRLGKPEEALEHYRRAVELGPVAAHGSLIEIGRIQLELGSIDEAERHGRMVLDRLPVEGNDLLCRAALRRGDRAAARDHARRAVDAETVPRAESIILLAQVEMVGGAFVDALELLDRLRQRSIERQSRPIPNLELERGEALAYLGRNAEAAAAFEAEIRDFPANLAAYSKLAFVYAVSKEFDRIDPLLERMVAAQPGPDALALAADTAARLGDENGSRAWRLRAQRFGVRDGRDLDGDANEAPRAGEGAGPARDPS